MKNMLNLFLVDYSFSLNTQIEKGINRYKSQVYYFILIISCLCCSVNFAFSQNTGDYIRGVPPKGKALVYFLRPAKAGFVIGMKVFVNGQEFGKTKGGKFLYGYFSPDEYTFLTKSENKKEITLSLEADKVYYLKQKVKMGIAIARTDWQILAEAEGKKVLKKCKLSKFQVEPNF